MTTHISAKKEDIAKKVLMPGDPLRAKWIAETFLTNAKLVNTTRNMFAYTGKYKGQKITIFAHGMGLPSIGIYSHELFKFYDVDIIYRIGSAGSLSKNVKLRDIVVVNGAWSKSTFAEDYGVKVKSNTTYPDGSSSLKIIETAKKLKMKTHFEKVISEDVFYNEVTLERRVKRSKGAVAVEMESFSLFAIAQKLNKKAACILTISDLLYAKAELTTLERQNSMCDMAKLALETIIEDK